MQSFTIRSSPAFLAALERQRPDPSEADAGNASESRLTGLPVMPWVTPKVPAALVALMRRVGFTKTFAAGEYIFPPEASYGALVLLTKGLGGRAFGSLFNQPTSALALSIPGRIIGGNHCFWSEFPGIGRYMALTPAEALFAPRDALKAELRKDASLMELTAAHLDLCLQSDRIAFGAIALLPVRLRILMLALSWALVYGRLERTGQCERIVASPGLSVELVSRVVSANVSQVKRDYAALRASGAWERTEDGFTIDASLLDAPWLWLKRSEEHVSRHPRPTDWRTLLV